METRSNYIMVGAVTVALLAGVLLFIVIFLVPHGARQVAFVAQSLIGKLRKN